MVLVNNEVQVTFTDKSIDATYEWLRKHDLLDQVAIIEGQEIGGTLVEFQCAADKEGFLRILKIAL